MKQSGVSELFDLKFVFIIIIYLVSATFLIKFYKYQISPDSISYISIAQKYLHGDFKNAINGIWPPLYSWLLIPALYFGFEPLLASVILTAFIGLFILMAAKLFLQKFDLSEDLSIVILFSLIPIIISFAFSGSPPDFFNIFFLLVYFNIIFDNNYAFRKLNGLLCGILGSLAYFSKAYALPFFIIHFLFFHLIHYFKIANKNSRNKVVKNLAIGLLTFVIISGVWIVFISVKYEQLTYSTAAKFNYLAAGPESESKGGPYFYEGFFAPPNDTAISAWEDPTYHTMTSWSPFESWDLFKYQIKLILHNTKRTKLIMRSYSRLSQLILISYLLLVILPVKKLLTKDKILFPASSLLLYCSGYCLIIVESRYLWITNFLLIFMGGYLLNLLIQSGRFNRIQKYLLIVFFAATFIFPPVKFLKSNLNTKKSVYLLSQKLQNEFKIAGNLAANKHHWTLYIAYYIGARYFGQAQDDLDQMDFQDELTRHNIDYFFVWGESNKYLNYLKKYEEITGGEIPGLRLYHLQQSK